VAYGGTGNDEVLFFGGGGGTAYGGAGTDILQLLDRDGNALTVDLSSQTLNGHGSYVGVTFAGFEALDVTAGSGNDVIIAAGANDRIVVGIGENRVLAGDGDDLVSYGTRGASTLDGGAGQDTLQVDAAGSALYFIFDHFDGDIDDGQGSVLTGFESFDATGSQFGDIAVFDTGNDRFIGYTGDDTALGYDGHDKLFGQEGNDSLDGGSAGDQLIGGTGNDTLDGGLGNDFLGGGPGDDLVFGGGGDDRIRVRTGHDTITGGTGHDVIIFAPAPHGMATITDFETGIDHLGFIGADLAAGLAAGPLDPSRLALGAASGSLGQFVLSYDAGTDTSTLVWDSNGADPAGTVETFALFDGHIVLSAQDILIF